MKPPLRCGAPCLKKWCNWVEYTQRIHSAGRFSGVPSRHFQCENSLSIIFVGLPGSGKTTIGRQLARRLDVPFVDSDHVIEHQLGCSIREFFAREGEDIFRDVEQQVLNDLTLTHQGVIATGGGAVLREANRRHLHERGQVVYLRSTPEDVYRRVRYDKARPLLQVGDPLARLRSLFEVRDPLYREAAHFVIETGRPSVATLVNMIAMQLELAGHLPALDRASIPPATQPPPL
jgi:shikimate kinase